VLNGQRAKALRYYEEWRAGFRKELGIDPMPQTARLIDDIRSGRIFDGMDRLKEQFFVPPRVKPLARPGERMDAFDPPHSINS